MPEKQKRTIAFEDKIPWIIGLFFVWYLNVGGILQFGLVYLVRIMGLPSDWAFVSELYTTTIGGIIPLIFFCLLARNRWIGKSFLPSKEGKTTKMFLIGILLGFITNFFCIVCALIHGDIKLYFDFSAKGIPLMVFAFISVFIQSSSEELWCRGMLYERIHVYHPLWVSILVNSLIFGLLHGLNPGITVFAMVDLILCGFAYSLLRWYSGSIWTCMGIHTMWNYTQNLIFGLPNSGLVSETSIFHMDAANAMSNWVYDFEFGVEGAVPAVLTEVALIVVILYLAKKNGRLGELKESKYDMWEKQMQYQAQNQGNIM